MSLTSGVPSPVITKTISPHNINIVVPQQRTGYPLPTHSFGSEEDLITCAQPRPSLTSPSPSPQHRAAAATAAQPIPPLELSSFFDFDERHDNPRILKNSILQILSPHITTDEKYAGIF